MIDVLVHLTRLGALALLGFALFQARKLASDIISNVDQFGDDRVSKHSVARKASTDYYLAFATVAVLVSGIFGLLKEDLLVAALTAVLTGLGVKMTIDFRSQ